MTTSHNLVADVPSVRSARALLLTGLSALALSLLMLAAMRISTNPVPGEFAHDLMAWLRDVAAVAGAMLMSIAFALRQVMR
jgi:hypothetical protein